MTTKRQPPDRQVKYHIELGRRPSEDRAILDECICLLGLERQPGTICPACNLPIVGDDQ